MERQCAKLMNLSAEKTGSNMHTRVSLPTCEQGLCGWRILTQDLRHTLVLSLKTVWKMGLSLQYNFFSSFDNVALNRSHKKMYHSESPVIQAFNEGIII